MGRFESSAFKSRVSVGRLTLTQGVVTQPILQDRGSLSCQGLMSERCELFSGHWVVGAEVVVGRWVAAGGDSGCLDAVCGGLVEPSVVVCEQVATAVVELAVPECSRKGAR